MFFSFSHSLINCSISNCFSIAILGISIFLNSATVIDFIIEPVISDSISVLLLSDSKYHFNTVGLIFSLFALIIQNCDGISFPSIFSSTYIILFGDNKRNSKSPFCASLSLKFLFVLNVSLFFKENSS